MSKKLSFKEQLVNIEMGNPPPKNAGIFGLDVSPEEAELVLIPVPWEATTSYGGGTAQAPLALKSASHQLDLHDLTFGQPYKKGICLLDAEEKIHSIHVKCLTSVKEYRESENTNHHLRNEKLLQINAMGLELNSLVEKSADYYLQKGKKVAVIGGEHSVPFGLLSSLSKVYENFGILHIDAHFDLRKSYEDFTWSHASIMYNVLEAIPQVTKIAHFGIRDFSTPEFKLNEAYIQKQRALTFFDHDIQKAKIKGQTFKQFVDQSLSFLPKNIYVSFDIDGLTRDLCPSTGTPVPGGMRFNEACYLLEAMSQAGKNIIGFDLCEVAPCPSNSEWDENVGSRILYKLCGSALYNK